MKNLLIILALLVSFSTQAQKKAPESVQNKFKSMFATAEKAKFSKEKDGSWEVDFKQNMVKSSAKFSANGEWLETEQNIKFAETPASVQEFVKSKYAGFDVETCEKVSTPEATSFEVFVEKGKQYLELKITPEGKLIEEKKAKKSESDDDEDEKDEKEEKKGKKDKK